MVEESEPTFAPLFTCLGYSAPETNTQVGFSLNFRVNNEAIKEYMEITGKTVTYGLFAITKDALGDKDIIAANGEIADGAVVAEIPFDSFVFIKIKMAGFDTAELKASLFAIGTYVAVQDGESKEYSYLQATNPEEGAKYSFVSYNYIVGSLQ